MIANENKSYLPYLNKLVDQYNNTYHLPIKKKLLMLIILLRLKTLTPKSKVNDRVRITKHKNLFSKGYTENWS